MEHSRVTFTRRSALLGAAAVGGVLAGAGPVAATSGPRRLTLRQQAGQRVVWSYPGPTPPPALLEAVRRGEVGGVIFFGENIPTVDQVKTAVTALRRAHAESGVRWPLLLTTDQEGGKVRRLPGAPEQSAKQVGASADPAAAAHDAGDGAAANLRSVDMNANLAPVLDVFREPGNFDDEFGRSFSDDPAVVSTCGTAFLRAQRRHRVASTVKHFPGLGAAAQDENTDLVRVVLDVPLADLRAIDERPFSGAIHAGVEMVMTSWAVYPALDPKLPAGLSPTIVRGELRHRLGFRGVTITDALEAGSLKEYGDAGERSVMAARAGMDMLLASGRDVAQGTAVVDALVAARRARLRGPEWTAALERVLRLRARLP